MHLLRLVILLSIGALYTGDAIEIKMPSFVSDLFDNVKAKLPDVDIPGWAKDKLPDWATIKSLGKDTLAKFGPAFEELRKNIKNSINGPPGCYLAAQKQLTDAEADHVGKISSQVDKIQAAFESMTDGILDKSSCKPDKSNFCFSARSPKNMVTSGCGDQLLGDKVVCEKEGISTVLHTDLQNRKILYTVSCCDYKKNNFCNVQFPRPEQEPAAAGGQVSNGKASIENHKIFGIGLMLPIAIMSTFS